MKTLKTTLFIAISSAMLTMATLSPVRAADSGFCQSATCQSEFNKLEKMAYFGSGEAATVVAVAYATGEGVQQDSKKARRHIKQAVRWRQPIGMHQMSVWLRQGFIFEQDVEKANELLDAAAKAKFGPALTDKAKLLLAKDTPEADKEAIALLELANEQYYSPGRYLLAQLLASGVAVEADLARAGQLFKNLALVGYADSRQQLDNIISVLEQFTQQDNKNTELLAVVAPVLAELKQINDIEVFKVQGQQFNINSELSNVVNSLSALKLYEKGSTGSRIPGNLCGRGTGSCLTTFDRSKNSTFNATTLAEYIGQ